MKKPYAISLVCKLIENKILSNSNINCLGNLWETPLVNNSKRGNTYLVLGLCLIVYGVSVGHDSPIKVPIVTSMYVDLYALWSFCSSRFPCTQSISPHVSHPFPHTHSSIVLLFQHDLVLYFYHLYFLLCQGLTTAQVQVLRHRKGVGGRGIVLPPNKFHRSGWLQITWVIFIYTLKQLWVNSINLWQKQICFTPQLFTAKIL